MERLKRYLEETKKKRFIDIGTGVGNYIHLLRDLYDGYEEIIGIDSFDKMIDRAKQSFQDERIKFEVMDAYEMTYPKESFDVVILSNSLHHLADIPKMLEVMKNTINKDGFIIISEMLADGLDKRQLSHKKLHHFAAKLDRLRGDIHNETYTKQEILSHLNHCGLVIEESWEMEFPKKEENTKDEIDHLLKMVDQVSQRIPEGNQELLDEKEEIKTYIKEHGFDGCTTFTAILRKQ